jgi:hypothetical protein
MTAATRHTLTHYVGSLCFVLFMNGQQFFFLPYLYFATMQPAPASARIVMLAFVAQEYTRTIDPKYVTMNYIAFCSQVSHPV